MQFCLYALRDEGDYTGLEFRIRALYGMQSLGEAPWPFFSNSIAFVSKTHGMAVSKKPTRGPLFSEHLLYGLVFRHGGIN